MCRKNGSMERLDETPVELDARSGDGLEIFLMWYRQHGVLSIMLNDLKVDPPTHTEFFIPNEKAREAFQHPFAWIPDEER